MLERAIQTQRLRIVKDTNDGEQNAIPRSPTVKNARERPKPAILTGTVCHSHFAAQEFNHGEIAIAHGSDA
ncbi:MAG: hypothetical protein J5J06_01275 [Phycisphaerae bacterium]|nr:hypothetical protein [Phycisphaerae bacterium]